MGALHIRGRVIGARRPYKEDGWDLDLTYICKDRIIVMGFPQSGGKSGYRNNWKDVSFFNSLNKLGCQFFRKKTQKPLHGL